MLEMSSRQLAEWDAFERIEGFLGGRGAWDRARVLAMALTGAKTTHGDFMPWVERPRMTPKAFRAQFAHLVAGKKKRS